MNESTTVRRIHGHEGAQWRELRLRALADNPIAFVETVEQAGGRADSDWRNMVARHATGGEEALFIAERNGAWVGVAGGFTRAEGTTTIFTVFVDPLLRGQQVLERLLHAVSEWSSSCGRAALTLEVAVQNVRAHAAYRRLGFTETGRTRVHPLYPDITEAEMTRPATIPPP